MKRTLPQFVSAAAEYTSRGAAQLTLWMVVALTTACIAFGAEPTFEGVWKFNLEKSRMTGETIQFEKNASGGVRMSSATTGYDFDLTGREYPVPSGGSASVQEVNSHTWELTRRRNGKVTQTTRFRLEGDVLTTVGTILKPDGAPLKVTQTWKRVSGDAGFFGKWKSTEWKAPTTVLEIETANQDAITVSFPDLQWLCAAKFDGQEHPIKIAGQETKLTYSLERTGPRKFKAITRAAGKVSDTDFFALSADGKTLTIESDPASGNEVTKSVWERK